MAIALIIFAVMYILLLLLPKYRYITALAAAALFLILGILPPSAAISSIDFNVLLMIAGTMGTVALFIESGMPSLMADIIIEKTPNVKWTIVALSLFAGIVSAFIDNVATVLMIAPVAMEMARKFDISPVPMIISISVSSNLQGAATLVGDTTAILLGSYADMTFTDFFVFMGRPGMFFIVEIGAVLTMFVLLFLMRKNTQKITPGERTRVTDYTPTVLLAGTVILLIAASFWEGRPALTNGIICAAVYIAGLIIRVVKYSVKNRKLRKLGHVPSKKAGISYVFRSVLEIDYQTILLLAGLFIVIGGITQVGVIDVLAGLIAKAGGSSTFAVYTIIVWGSVLISAFIDNIPYTATMLPVVQTIALTQGIEPYVLYFGLLAGATLGGNLTPVGASANITVIGILRKGGYEVKNRDFLRIGVPFSLVAVISGYILIWLFYGI